MNLNKAMSNNLKDASPSDEKEDDNESDIADEKCATNVDNNDVMAYQDRIEVKLGINIT